MSFLKQLRKARGTEASKKLQRARLITWRREPSIVKADHPTRLGAAKSVGYKAKQGVVVVRIRVPRGGKKRPMIKKGRRSKRKGVKLVLSKSYKSISEERVARKYPNMEVLNSYLVGKDGRYYWHEVILIDLNHPGILKDKQYSQLVMQTNRVFRGLTSSAKKSRGLRSNKGKGAEKLRPSRNSNMKRRKNLSRK